MNIVLLPESISKGKNAVSELSESIFAGENTVSEPPESIFAGENTVLPFGGSAANAKNMFSEYSAK
ncbi:MAG: hypothetical protein LBP63_07700 [Prevotellaceae bacterium]|jgi:hypothetical protein|nr:hypothetical protein [Prevotellaceae bacterium]